MSARIRIGCSGWEYRHWRGTFYPADLPQSRWLEHYASRFDTVELNGTFYRLPETKTFDRWREHYFPQMWERPNQVQSWVKSVLLGKRPIEGPKSFTKHRVFDDIQQGLDAGFKPLTTNPIKLALAKVHEMDRYIMAHETLSAMKEKELAKPVMVGEQPPAGWQKLDDRIGTIYGNPNIPLKEHFDYNVWTTLSKLAKSGEVEKAERGYRLPTPSGTTPSSSGT